MQQTLLSSHKSYKFHSLQGLGLCLLRKQHILCPTTNGGECGNRNCYQLGEYLQHFKCMTLHSGVNISLLLVEDGFTM